MCGFNDRILYYLMEYSHDELDEDEDEYVYSVFEMAEDYARRGKIYLDLHIALQVITILSAVSLPILINMPSIDKLLLTLLSIVVALCVGLSSWVKLGVHAALSFEAHRNCAKELQEFHLLMGTYKGLDRIDAFKLFAERTQELRDHVVHATISSSAYTNFQPQSQPSRLENKDI